MSDESTTSDIADTPDQRPPGERMKTLAIYFWRRVPRPMEMIILISVYGFGLAAGLAATEVLLNEGTIDATGFPIWGKVFNSFVAFVLYFMHLKFIADARDRGGYRDLASRGDADAMWILILAIEGTLLAWVGELRLTAWAVAVVFSVLLRMDFFVPKLLHGKKVAHAVLHALAWPIVMSMLVALSWESTIKIGLVGHATVVTDPNGVETRIVVDGLSAVDLVTAVPIATALIYLCGFLIGLAAELVGIARRGEDLSAAARRVAVGSVVLAAAVAGVFMWHVYDVDAALKLAIMSFVAIVAGIAAGGPIARRKGWPRSMGITAATTVLLPVAMGVAMVTTASVHPVDPDSECASNILVETLFNCE